MRRLFYGLTAVLIATSASAFTNVNLGNGKFAGPYYITGETLIGGQPAYTFNTTPVTCPNTGIVVCQFTPPSALTSPQLKSYIESSGGVIIRKNSL